MGAYKHTGHPLHEAWLQAREERKKQGYGAIKGLCPYPSLKALFDSIHPEAGTDQPALIAKLVSEIKDNSFTLPEVPYGTKFRRRIGDPKGKKQRPKAKPRTVGRDSHNPYGNAPRGKKRGLGDQVPPETKASLAQSYEKIQIPTYGELSENPAWKKLGPQTSLFVYTYFATGFDLMKAFTSAWPEVKGTIERPLHSEAQLVLGRNDVIKALKSLVDYFLAERRIVLAPKILDVLEAQAFFDIGDLIDDDGTLVKPLHEMTREQRLCIKGIETKYYGKNADVSQKVVTLVDRQQSLDKLARFIALFTIDQPDNPPPPNPNNGGNHLHVHLPQDRVGHLKGIFQAASDLRLPNLNRGLEISPAPSPDDEDDPPAPEPAENETHEVGSVELEEDDVPPARSPADEED